MRVNGIITPRAFFDAVPDMIAEEIDREGAPRAGRFTERAVPGSGPFLRMMSAAPEDVRGHLEGGQDVPRRSTETVGEPKKGSLGGRAPLLSFDALPR